MTEDNLNAQAAPETNALEQSGINEASAPSVETEAPTSVDGATEAPVTAAPVEETITISKQKLDEKIHKAKAIAERRARREVDFKVQEEVKRFQSQVPQQPQQQQQPPQPSPQHIWDQSIGAWISPNMTLEEYASIAGVGNNVAAQPTAPQPNMTLQSQAAPVQQSYNDPLHKRAADQLDECAVEFDDFSDLALSEFNDNMLLAAASMPGDGIRQLYEITKNNPLDIYKIRKLASGDEQKFRVRDLIREHANAPKKIVTDVEAPPASLDGGSVSRNMSELTYSERKARSKKEYWGR